jgi:hypothetical protein
MKCLESKMWEHFFKEEMQGETLDGVYTFVFLYGLLFYHEDEGNWFLQNMVPFSHPRQ